MLSRSGTMNGLVLCLVFFAMSHAQTCNVDADCAGTAICDLAQGGWCFDWGGGVLDGSCSVEATTALGCNANLTCAAPSGYQVCICTDAYCAVNHTTTPVCSPFHNTCEPYGNGSSFRSVVSDVAVDSAFNTYCSNEAHTPYTCPAGATCDSLYGVCMGQVCTVDHDCYSAYVCNPIIGYCQLYQNGAIGTPCSNTTGTLQHCGHASVCVSYYCVFHCASELDCHGNTPVCDHVSGACQPYSNGTTGTYCSRQMFTQYACATGLHCNTDNRCEDFCVVDDDCPDFEQPICDSFGQCQPNHYGAPGTACSASHRCMTNLQCNSHICNGTSTYTCQFDADCTHAGFPICNSDGLCVAYNGGADLSYCSMEPNTTYTCSNFEGTCVDGICNSCIIDLDCLDDKPVCDYPTRLCQPYSGGAAGTYCSLDNHTPFTCASGLDCIHYMCMSSATSSSGSANVGSSTSEAAASSGDASSSGGFNSGSTASSSSSSSGEASSSTDTNGFESTAPSSSTASMGPSQSQSTSSVASTSHVAGSSTGTTTSTDSLLFVADSMIGDSGGVNHASRPASNAFWLAMPCAAIVVIFLSQF